MKRLRVGVIYGGRSGEHEVSVASAAAVIQNLDRARFEPVPIRIEKDGRWVLPERPPQATSAAEVIEHARSEASRAPRQGREVHLVAHPSDEPVIAIDRRGAGRGDNDRDRAIVTGLGVDLIFPVLHGPYGEDGTVQGLLELADLPYVGAGVLASAAGMDKAVMKRLFAARQLPMVESLTVLRRAWRAGPEAISARIVDRLGLPVFVKPANLGSSVGVSKVKTAAALGEAMELAAELDRKIVVEAAVPNAREIECSVLGNDEPLASVPGEIVPSREFYDYEAKYLDEGSRLLIPAPLDPEQTASVQAMAVSAFQAIDGAGMARVDFLMDAATGRIVVNEVNTIPGFTTISMYPKLWEASGLPYGELLTRLIELAIERHEDRRQERPAGKPPASAARS